MQQIIQQITQQLIDRLPDNKQYYRLDELQSWGIHSFVVRRIKIELERNLAESMIIPKTDWANTESDAVQEAWQQFVNAIRAEARLPASYAKAVIETAVADVLEMLVQPRKNIPQVIFGVDDQLSYEKVCQRMPVVVVYQHFARLIPRYMQKKQLKKLSQERCEKIVRNADAKLTEQYSPLNWAQMLEPLFKLVGGEIDTNLLRLFFEDKKMARVARKFDLMNDAVTRAELIEVLSSPELLNLEGYEEEQSTLFKNQPADEIESESAEKSDRLDGGADEGREPSENEAAAALDVQDTSIEEGSAEEQEREKSQSPDEATLNSGFADEEEKVEDVSRADENDDADTLNAIFDTPDEAENENQDTDTELTETAEDSEEINTQPPQSKEGPAPHEDKLSGSDSQLDAEEPVTDKQPENGQEKSAEEEATPIWMRFMSDEEIEEYEKQLEQENQHEIEEGFIDDPIIDLTKEDDADDQVDELYKYLKSDRALFVENIFGGSDRAYEEALDTIAGYGSWREVSEYIEKEIFKRNLVDVYSEAAVEFTDRLQTYFLEKQD